MATNTCVLPGCKGGGQVKTVKLIEIEKLIERATERGPTTALTRDC